MKNEGLAFFDLDHTLVPQDTQALFAQFVMSQERWRRVYLIWYLPCLLVHALGWLNLRTMKRVFFSHLVGMAGVRLRAYADEFGRELVPALIYPEMLDWIERLKDQGYQMVLISASPGFYVKEIGNALGFDVAIGTELEVEEEMPLLPEIVGPNNKRDAKIEALKQAGLIDVDYDPVESGPIPDSWAFSDSLSDLPLLSIAEHGVTIHPGPELARVSRERGWQCLKPNRPYRGQWGARLATVRLALGIGSRFLKPVQ